MSLSERSREKWLPALSRLASAFVIAVGCAAIIGWALDILPSFQLRLMMVPINPVTALTFVLSGISLWRLSEIRPNRISNPDLLGLILAGVVEIIAALKLADYLFGLGFHIDQVLFANKLFDGSAFQ